MKDQSKTKKQLIDELAELRQQIAELQQPENQQERAAELLRQSEARYRAVVEDQTELICRFLPGGTLTFVNEAYCRYFDKKCEDLIGSSFISLIPASDRQKVKAHFDSLGPENPVATHEHQVIGKNKEVRWQQWTNRAIFNKRGLIEEFQSVGRDITERKRTEKELSKAHDDLERRVRERTQELLEANKKLEQEIENRKHVENTLRDSEAYMKSILEAAPVGIGLVHNRVFVWVSDRMNEMLGYSEDELLGKSARVSYASDEEFERVGRDKYLEIQERGVGIVETRLKRKDGSIIDVLLCSSPIDPEDHSKGVIFTALDITERKQAEESLRESEERHRLLLESSPDPIVVYDIEGKATYINPAFAQVFGWSSEEVLDRRINFVPQGNWPETKAAIDRMLVGEKIHAFETKRLTKDGRILDIQLSSSLFHDRDGKSAGNIVILRDVTKQKLAEEALRESEENFKALAENANDGILIAVGEGTHVYANSRASEITGYSTAELLEITLHEFTAPDEVEKVAERFRKRLKGENVSGQYETALVRKSGEIFSAELSSGRTVWEGQPASIVIFRDITGRKQVEEALRKREAELEIRASELEELNSALRVLLKRREEDQKDLEEKVLSNVKELVLPYVERLKKSALDAKQDTYVNILESNLTDIVSPFVRQLSSSYLALTPTEIHVANLVKEARDTKTIAELLNMSPRTVESHRQNIRNKLGLKNKKANLRSHLLSIQ